MLRNDGRRDFVALLTKRGGAQASLVAFDLVRLEGEDLRLRPLEERREALQRLVARRPRDPLQRGARRRGRDHVRQGVRARPRRHRVEAGGQLLQVRQKPELAGGEEPGFRQGVTVVR